MPTKASPRGQAPHNEHDPEGSVSIIDFKSVKSGRKCVVDTADFNRFNPFKRQLLAAGVRIFGPRSTVAQDLEPEYIR